MEEKKSEENTLILIAGPVGSGKTTLALAIERFLRKEGFTNVSITDQDIATGTHYPDLQNKRFDALKARKIGIQTIQLRRRKTNNSV